MEGGGGREAVENYHFSAMIFFMCAFLRIMKNAEKVKNDKFLPDLIPETFKGHFFFVHRIFYASQFRFNIAKVGKFFELMFFWFI